MTHRLIIHSLHDASAECSCGGWSYVLAGQGDEQEIRSWHASHIQNVRRAAKDRKNAARRAKHAAYTSAGMVRVLGAQGGIYYE